MYGFSPSRAAQPITHSRSTVNHYTCAPAPALDSSNAMSISALTIRNYQAGDVQAVATLLMHAFTADHPPSAVDDDPAGWLEEASEYVPQQGGEFTGLVATLPTSSEHMEQGYNDDDNTCMIVACALLHHGGDVALAGPFATSIHLQSSGVMRQLLQAFNQKVDEQRIKHTILLHNMSSLASFTLYAKQGFRPSGVYMCIEGLIEGDDEPSQQQYTVRAMTAEDIDQCAALHKRCNGWDRRDMMAEQQRTSKHALVAVDSNLDVVGYWTEPTNSGHAVAINDDVLKALFIHMCQQVVQKSGEQLSAPVLAISHQNYELVCWFLQHKAIRATRQMCLMQRQANESVIPLQFAKNGVVFCSSVTG